MELRLRDEFQLNKFCLTVDDPEAFGSSQWRGRWATSVFVVYRLVAASYVIGWNIYGYVTIPTFGHHVTIVFYTNWSYLVLALHLTLALLVTLYHSARRKKSPPEVREEGSATQTQARPGSHVITICGGACAELPGNVLHYHLQECGQIEQSNLNAAGKRKQRTLGHNNNEYKAEEERGSRCRGGIGGGGDARRCNGAVGLPSSGGKQRSKGKSRGHDSQGVKEGKTRTKRRCKSVGVNCTDSGLQAEALDQPDSNHSNVVQSRDQKVRPVRTRPDGAPPHLVATADNRQKGRCRKRGSHHPEGYSRETQVDESRVDDHTLQPSGRDRNQRRRRQSKVCHRRGKAVAFKCRSSNSSLDKIRSRAGRRLTPDVKRRGRRSPRGGGRVEGPPASGSGGGRTADLSVAGGGGGGTWHTDVDRGDKDCGQAEPVASYRRGAACPRSHHRRGRSKTHSRSLSGPGAVGVEWVEEEVDVVGAHQPLHAATGSENRRLRSKPKGKHTFILQRSGGAARKLTMCEDRGIHTTADAPSAADPEVIGGSRATRSVGTNTNRAEVPQRISVIVENPAALPPTMEVVAPSTTTTTADRTDRPRSPPELPFYLKVSWVVFNMAAASAPVVSCVYFFVLFPMLKREQPSFQANILDINLHGINSLIVLLEVTLSAFPVRILHCIYPLAYGLSYVIFSVAYWALDKQNNVLYPVILDWNHPAVTAPVVVGLVGLATPVLQFIWYGVYRLRLWVYYRLYTVQPQTSSSSSGTHEATPSNRKETQV